LLIACSSAEWLIVVGFVLRFAQWPGRVVLLSARLRHVTRWLQDVARDCLQTVLPTNIRDVSEI
jgi:hypothetical protein